MGDMIVVKPIIDNLIKDVYAWGKNMISSIQGIADDLKKLKSNLSTIDAVLLDAEEKQFTDESVKDWLTKLQFAAWDAVDILDIYNTKACLANRKNRTVPGVSGAGKVSYKLEAAQKIKRILARIDEIAKEKENLHLEVKVDCPRPDNRPHTGFFVDKSDVVGRENDTNEIVQMLLSDEHDREGEICVVPITGIGGLGKTTLAQLVFDDERVKRHFSKIRMWICVTANFNLTRIIKEMVEYHTKLEIKRDLSQSQLEARLLDFLKDKPFLLVLDDVWTKEETDWNLLLQLLKLGGKGSRILITSRMVNVSDSNGTLPSYQLGYLPQEHCWEIFEKIAFIQNALIPNRNRLEDAGREIVSKCGGLPLAVKAMAGILRGNIDLKQWRNILKSETWEVEEQEIRPGKTKILPALKLSYDHLPSFLKRCFSYCSIFPKGYIFDKKELIKLWMAENYLQLTNRRQKMEKIGVSYFDELVMRSFFQPSIVDDRERFLMHDRIHDLSQSISIPYSFQMKNKDRLNHDEFEQSRHVSILCPDLEQAALRITENCKKLHTLLLPGDQVKNFGKSLDRLFQELKYLRALDLSSSTISELPSSIKKLKLLRYLDLSRTEIKELPESVCKLYNLQTLKLLGCRSFHKLPHNMGNLVNLQYLELDPIFWFDCSDLPPNIGNLTNLENWHSYKVSLKKGYDIAELKNMDYLSESLHISKLENAMDAFEAKLNQKESLENLTLEWSIREDDVVHHDEEMEEQILNDLQPDSGIKQLKICNFLGRRFPDWIEKGYLENLTTLILKGCSRSKTLSLNLPSLRLLNIKAMEELENCSFPNCNSMDTLKFSHCPKLKNLPKIFARLRVLMITGCNSLTELPLAPSLNFLILIENPVLEEWNEAILQKIPVNPEGNHQRSYLHTYANLLELKVVKCPKIKPLPRVFYPQKLEISGCELLNNLIPPERAVRLQVLALHEFLDDRLVKEIPRTDTLYSLSILNISNFFSVPKWPSLPKLNALYIHGCKDLLKLSEEEGSFLSLTSLKLLSIRDCPKLETLPVDGLPNGLEYLSLNLCPILGFRECNKGILKNLSLLKDLYIEDCPKLGSLPEDGVSSGLKHLKIQGCPLLAENCRRNVGQDWPKIMHIPDVEI